MFNLVEHGNAILEIVSALAGHGCDVDAAQLAVVAAAVESGVRAGRHREWSRAWSLLDAVHNGGLLFTEPKDWDHVFFLDAFTADFEGRDDKLGDAIRELRARVEGRFRPKENPPKKI